MSRPHGSKDKNKRGRVGNGLADRRLPGNGHAPSAWSALRGAAKIDSPVQRIAESVWSDLFGKKRESR